MKTPPGVYKQPAPNTGEEDVTNLVIEDLIEGAEYCAESYGMK